MIDEAVLDVMTGLAHEAGAILMKGFRNPDLEISFKGKRDLVTDMDRRSEAFLVAEIRKRFPGHSIVAEEGSSFHGNEPFTWHIDPLDGTNNYAHGVPFFAVNIAIFDEANSRVAAGVTFDPVHGETFTALHGKGARCNGKVIRVSATDNLGDALLVTGFPYDKDDPATNNTRECAAFMPKIRCLRRFGSAALDLCSIAVGRLDGYWERGLNSWDIAPGILIVREAGGMVTGYDGVDANLATSSICASNGKIHAGMISTIRG